MNSVVFEVAVLDDADKSGDLGFGAEFLGDLADEGYLNALAWVDVAAGQERPGLRVLAGGQGSCFPSPVGGGDRAARRRPAQELIGLFVRRAYIPEHLRPGRAERSGWPFTVPCVAQLIDDGPEFIRPVTFLIGDNGSGKTTLRLRHTYWVIHIHGR